MRTQVHIGASIDLCSRSSIVLEMNRNLLEAQLLVHAQYGAGAFGISLSMVPPSLTRGGNKSMKPVMVLWKSPGIPMRLKNPLHGS